MLKEVTFSPFHLFDIPKMMEEYNEAYFPEKCEGRHYGGGLFLFYINSKNNGKEKYLDDVLALARTYIPYSENVELCIVDKKGQGAAKQRLQLRKSMERYIDNKSVGDKNKVVIIVDETLPLFCSFMPHVVFVTEINTPDLNPEIKGVADNDYFNLCNRNPPPEEKNKALFVKKSNLKVKDLLGNTSHGIIRDGVMNLKYVSYDYYK